MRNLKSISAFLINVCYWSIILLTGLQFEQYVKYSLIVMTLICMILIWNSETAGYEFFDIGFFLFSFGFGILCMTLFCMGHVMLGDDGGVLLAVLLGIAECWIFAHILLGGEILQTMIKLTQKENNGDVGNLNAKLVLFLFPAAIMLAIDVIIFSQ